MERRRYSIRNDINNLFRNPSGELSGAKIGTYVAQYISARILLTIDVLPSWDVLAVLFLVLIAPEAYKKLLAMKWGGGSGYSERTEITEHTKTATTNKDKVDEHST